MKPSRSLLGASLLAAIAASLCCITPVLAMLAGITGIASVFSWLEPFRPYLIALTVIILGFAWYRAYKAKKAEANCACENGEIEKKKKFINTTGFLLTVTIAAIVLTTFPYYSKIFFSEPKLKETIIADKNNLKEVKFNIDGMTCEGCQAHVNEELSKVSGVIDYKTSYKEGTSIVTFDRSKTNIDSVIKAIDETGYHVRNYSIIKK